ncbi:hypothetical protein Sgou_00360 [Streptomyces gougerotii]|uniref:HTH araC/xylS-type domain-containing protein n=1 Tax=Streptomyces gougerotii TaxID=53448 RepID=A0ABQ1CYH9_9ACTN|nr:hypothetical protein Sgou_00360 [Streptomyces gougerotii]
MPPHTWLTDARVRRARTLLQTGVTPAETATAVGFTDQPHLNRHFTRIVGVTPGAYRRARRGGVRRRGGAAPGFRSAGCTGRANLRETRMTAARRQGERGAGARAAPGWVEAGVTVVVSRGPPGRGAVA